MSDMTGGIAKTGNTAETCGKTMTDSGRYDCGMTLTGSVGFDW